MEKAVVLARGLGTRMRRSDAAAVLDPDQAAAANSGAKALIPIGRPFLDYVLSALADCGYERICLVVARENKQIRDYYENTVRLERIRIEFAVQPEPKGTADAVAAARSFAGNDPFLVINSDTYYPFAALTGLQEVDGSGTALFEPLALSAGGNIPAERVWQFAIGRVDSANRLVRIVEKPDRQSGAVCDREIWVSMNCWRFSPSIFEACRKIERSDRGEFEIPDAVQYAIDVLGEPFHVVKVRAGVLDLTSRRDIATVTDALRGIEVRL